MKNNNYRNKDYILNTRKSIILVTTANWKTGSETVKLLLKKGYKVRAMVHKIDNRSNEIKELWAELFEWDLLNIKSVKLALKDIDSAYFCFPFIEWLLEGATNFAIAAKKENIKRVVNMSQKSAYEAHKSPASRQHWLAEHILDWADIWVVHIRPTLFSSNILRMAWNSIVTDGKIYLPYWNWKHAPVSYIDIAYVISNLLININKKHNSEKYVITWPKEYTIYDFSKIIWKKINKNIEYINIPIDVWWDALIKLPFMNSHFVRHLKELALDIQNWVLEGVTDIVKTIGNKEPETFEDFIDNNIKPFLEITNFNN